MAHVKKRKKIIKKDNYTVIKEEIYIDNQDRELLGLKYNDFCFDKERMEDMAREAGRVFENYEMEQELKALEEENYYALSERYRTYTTFELIKKIFM